MRPAILSIAATALLMTSEVRANGRFPAASAIVVDPGNASHLVAETTFGILESHDAGATFGWICEGVVGYGGNEDAIVAILPGERLVVAAYEGLFVGEPGSCSFARASGTPAIAFVDVAVDASHPDHAVAIAFDNANTTALYRTDDGGASWTAMDASALSMVAPATVEIADGAVYVSGVRFDAAASGVLAIIDPNGSPWALHDVAFVPGETSVYIGAVDRARSRIYLRTKGDNASRLLVAHDDGATLTDAGSFTGSMLGLALSPDTKTIAIGGYSAGLLVASTDELAFSQRASAHVVGLRWADAGLFVLGSPPSDPFAIGLTMDGGQTFATLLPSFRFLSGPISCPAGTPYAASCDSLWPNVEGILGIDGGTPPPPDPGLNPIHSSEPKPASGASGCGCSSASGRPGTSLGGMIALLAAAAWRRSGRRPPLRREPRDRRAVRHRACHQLGDE